MTQKLNKREEGFTIIEVLIVLAIAALILLIVFLAVPALQRNSRNNSRNSDVSSIIGAMNEYVDNTGGTVPATCTGATPCPFLANAKTGFYGSGGWTAAEFKFTNNGTTPGTSPNPGDVNNVRAASYASCNGAGTASVAGASPRQIAVTYDVETGGGGMQQECRTVQ